MSNMNKPSSLDKSKHKHIYKDCLIKYPLKNYFTGSNFKVTSAKYCTVCGKLTDKKNVECEHKDGFYRNLSNDEVIEKHSGVPLFDLEDFFIDHVPIVRSET